MPTEDELEILWAEREITRVILTYARAVDRLDFGLLRTCFHPDARLHYGEHWSGDLEAGLAWLERSLPKLAGTQHDFGAPFIELDLEAGVARCDTYSVNSALYRPDTSGRQLHNVSGTRYEDRFERREGAWRIVERRNRRVWSRNFEHGESPPDP
ncbi:MAG: nuclear transport factor 2 family protein [Spirochaetaceae bacterium]|nr:nuclear transport factor 2 family protein [Myxococcales bacterium]MCB9724782.1 nuclear transport factor 2 family protein [Spirochaetaceae bacterium]